MLATAMMLKRWYRFPLLFLYSLAMMLSIIPTHVSAQTVPLCGVVDALVYPVSLGDTLYSGYDDFGIYRARFTGYHTGFDMAFGQRGTPVAAMAKGRVTYSNPLGWGTEQGVVILEHIMPNGSQAFSVYGHMEELRGNTFPLVGTCVDAGDIIGSVGAPSRGRPHLHFEIRTFLASDGGPGYSPLSPLSQGWLNPLDFIHLWQTQIATNTLFAITFDRAPTLPPVALDSGLIMGVRGRTISAYTLNTSLQVNTPTWSVDTLGQVIHLAALSGGRVVAYTNRGQVVALTSEGRYINVWNVLAQPIRFRVVNEQLIFATDSGIAAYSITGDLIWQTTIWESDTRVSDIETNGDQMLVVSHRDEGVYLHLLSASGTPLTSAPLQHDPAVSFTRYDHSWRVLDGQTLYHLDAEGMYPLAQLDYPSGVRAQMAVDAQGVMYLYPDDDGASLSILEADGTLRWSKRYPVLMNNDAPLVGVGSGCVLYTLDPNGTLHLFNVQNGDELNSLQLYAGGQDFGASQARFLRVDAQDRIFWGSGFLSVLTIEGRPLLGDYQAECDT